MFDLVSFNFTQQRSQCRCDSLRAILADAVGAPLKRKEIWKYVVIIFTWLSVSQSSHCIEHLVLRGNFRKTVELVMLCSISHPEHDQNQGLAGTSVHIKTDRWCWWQRREAGGDWMKVHIMKSPFVKICYWTDQAPQRASEKLHLGHQNVNKQPLRLTAATQASIKRESRSDIWPKNLWLLVWRYFIKKKSSCYDKTSKSPGWLYQHVNYFNFSSFGFFAPFSPQVYRAH